MKKSFDSRAGVRPSRCALWGQLFSTQTFFSGVCDGHHPLSEMTGMVGSPDAAFAPRARGQSPDAAFLPRARAWVGGRYRRVFSHWIGCKREWAWGMRNEAAAIIAPEAFCYTRFKRVYQIIPSCLRWSASDRISVDKAADIAVETLGMRCERGFERPHEHGCAIVAYVGSVRVVGNSVSVEIASQRRLPASVWCFIVAPGPRFAPVVLPNTSFPSPE